jgi:hypothetical protein
LSNDTNPNVISLSNNTKRKRKESIESIESTELSSGSEWEEEATENSDSDLDQLSKSVKRFSPVINHTNYMLPSITQTNIDIVQDIMKMLECRSLQGLVISIGMKYAVDEEMEAITHSHKSSLTSATSIPIKKNNLGVNSTPRRLKYVQIDSDSDSEELACLSEVWNIMKISSTSSKNTNKMNNL